MSSLTPKASTKDEDAQEHLWSVGELHRAVLKENKKEGYDNVITYAPDGRVVLLEHRTNQTPSPGDVVEVYITEQKPRSYYGRTIQIIKRYEEIQQLSESRKKQFEKQLQWLAKEPMVGKEATEKVKKIHKEVDKLMNKVNQMAEKVSERE